MSTVIVLIGAMLVALASYDLKKTISKKDKHCHENNFGL
jgi:hypothetical protein